METSTRIVNGITFVSNVKDLSEMRAGDILAIAFIDLGHHYTTSHAQMAKAIKNKSSNIEIVNDAKYAFTLSAKFN